MCSHFLNCYKTCESNANCKDQSTPCCSQGYCTDKIVCDGNKIINDTCTYSSECMTDFCDPLNNICVQKPLDIRTIDHNG